MGTKTEREETLSQLRKKIASAERSSRRASEQAARSKWEADAALGELAEIKALAMQLSKLKVPAANKPARNLSGAPLGRPTRGGSAAWVVSLRTSIVERAYIASATGGTWSPKAARDLALSAPSDVPEGLPDLPARCKRGKTSLGLNADEVAYLGRRANDPGAADGETSTTTLRRLALWGAAAKLAEI